MEARPAASLSLEAGHEAALVLATQRGEPGACAELLQHYHRFLHRLCLALTHDVVRSHALECAVARELWRGRHELQVGRPLLPHLVQLVRTLASAQARGHQPPSLRPNGLAWESGALGAHDVGYERRLLAALAAQPLDDQLLLALRLCERLPYPDVAALTGTNAGSAAGRVAYVREQLAAALLERKAA